METRKPRMDKNNTTNNNNATARQTDEVVSSEIENTKPRGNKCAKKSKRPVFLDPTRFIRKQSVIGCTVQSGIALTILVDFNEQKVQFKDIMGLKESGYRDWKDVYLIVACNDPNYPPLTIGDKVFALHPHRNHTSTPVYHRAQIRAKQNHRLMIDFLDGSEPCINIETVPFTNVQTANPLITISQTLVPQDHVPTVIRRICVIGTAAHDNAMHDYRRKMQQLKNNKKKSNTHPTQDASDQHQFLIAYSRQYPQIGFQYICNSKSEKDKKFTCKCKDVNSIRHCDRQFGEKCHWMRHCLETHVSKELSRRYKCKQCNMKYKQHSLLEEHVARCHNNNAPSFKCPYCAANATFTRWTSVLRHCRKQHSEREEPKKNTTNNNHKDNTKEKKKKKKKKPKRKKNKSDKQEMDESGNSNSDGTDGDSDSDEDIPINRRLQVKAMTDILLGNGLDTLLTKFCSKSKKQRSKHGASPRKTPSKPKQKLNEKGKQSIHENIEAKGREKDTDKAKKKLTGRKRKLEEISKTNGAKSAMDSNETPAKKARKYYPGSKRSDAPPQHGQTEIPTAKAYCLSGIRFVITGQLPSLTRDECSDLIKQYGGRVTSAVSGMTRYLICGAEPLQSKTDTAKAKRVTIIDEAAFLDLLRTLPAGKAPSPGKSDEANNGNNSVQDTGNTEANTHKNASKPTLIPLLSAVECEEGEIQQIKPLDESKLNETDVWFEFIGSYPEYEPDIQRVIMICEGFTNDVQFRTHKLDLESAGSDLRTSLRLNMKHKSAKIQCKIYEILQNAKNKITANNPYNLSALYHLTETSSSLSARDISAASVEENARHNDDCEHKSRDELVPFESESSEQLQALLDIEKDLTPPVPVCIPWPSPDPPKTKQNGNKTLRRCPRKERHKRPRPNGVSNAASDDHNQSSNTHSSVPSIEINKASVVPQKRKSDDTNTNAPSSKKRKVVTSDPPEQRNANSIPQHDKEENTDDSSEEYDLQQMIENLTKMGIEKGLIEFVIAEIDPNPEDFNGFLLLCLNNREYFDKYIKRKQVYEAEEEEVQESEGEENQIDRIDLTTDINNANNTNNGDTTKWSANDCAAWVGSLGDSYNQYMQLFSNGIDGALLTQLDDTALAQIIDSKLHRTKILQSWHGLQNT